MADVKPVATFYLPMADLNFTFPGNYPVAAIKVYQVDWDGKKIHRSLCR